MMQAQVVVRVIEGEAPLAKIISDFEEAMMILRSNRFYELPPVVQKSIVHIMLRYLAFVKYKRGTTLRLKAKTLNDLLYKYTCRVFTPTELSVISEYLREIIDVTGRYYYKWKKAKQTFYVFDLQNLKRYLMEVK